MRVYPLPGAKLGFRLFGWVLFGAVCAGSPEVRAERFCEYVPGTEAGANRADSGAAGSYVHRVTSADCVNQCIARVFCTSDEKEKNLSLLEKVKRGTVVNCNAHRQSREDRRNGIAGCPTANECMAEADLEPSRKAKSAKPSVAGKAKTKTPMGDVTAIYSADAKTVLMTIPRFEFPVQPGEDGEERKKNPKSCSFCASPTLLNEKISSFAVCPAGKTPGACPPATDCASSEDDPAGLSVVVVPPQQRKTAAPATEPTTAAPPARRADGGGGGR